MEKPAREETLTSSGSGIDGDVLRPLVVEPVERPAHRNPHADLRRTAVEQLRVDRLQERSVAALERVHDGDVERFVGDEVAQAARRDDATRLPGAASAIALRSAFPNAKQRFGNGWLGGKYALSSTGTIGIACCP